MLIYIAGGRGSSRASLDPEPRPLEWFHSLLGEESCESERHKSVFAIVPSWATLNHPV